jgi:hypothetical protein
MPWIKHRDQSFDNLGYRFSGRQLGQRAFAIPALLRRRAQTPQLGDNPADIGINFRTKALLDPRRHAANP